jgi:uncharacterized repeat protein (TIGR03803 family)
MKRIRQACNSQLAPKTFARLLALTLLLPILVVSTSHAQTFSVLHNFTGPEGWGPSGTPTLDQGGNLYGTTSAGGSNDAGTVFKLTPHDSSWLLSSLYSFPGSYSANCTTGGCPNGVIRDGSGVLYGTTSSGGAYNNGTVFQLRPSATLPSSVRAPWNETILYSFDRTGGAGYTPTLANLAIDRQGNLYGTTEDGGIGECSPPGCGTVYQLTPSAGGFTYSTIYEFTFAGPNDGAIPFAGVTLDSAGNLYGTTILGGSSGCGTVYKLTPSGSGWTEAVIYNFTCGTDGQEPFAGIAVGNSGNLFGGALYGTGSPGGSVFELSPSGGGWVYSQLQLFTTGGQGPSQTLAVDSAGNVYGTTPADGLYGGGNVFKLTPSNGSWIYTSLHDFTCGQDGCAPGGVALDATGNLFGVANVGGLHETACFSYDQSCGLVWEITP